MKFTQRCGRGISWLLSAALALTLAGCGGTADRSSGGGGLAGNRVGTGGALSSTGGPAFPTDIENNGGDFVRVGRKVYFRRYGPASVHTTVVYGEFFDGWNSAGGESAILCHDLDTGETDALWTEAGYGPLYYGDGGFYLRERSGERDYVVWYSLDGTQSERLCGGTALGITPEGLLAVDWAGNGEPDAWRLYRNTALACSVSHSDTSVFAGLTEDGLFYLDVTTEVSVGNTAGEAGPGTADAGENTESGENTGNGEDTGSGEDAETPEDTGADTGTPEDTGDGVEERTVRTLWQLTPEGEQICLGTLPDTEEEFYYETEVDSFAAGTVEGQDSIGVSVGYYAGTAHALNEYTSVCAVPGQADSLQELEPPPYPMEEAYAAPRMAADGDGVLSFIPYGENELRVNWETGDLERYSGEAWEVLSPGVAAYPEDGTGYRRIVQSAQWVDGGACVSLACVHAAPAENIGWREAYTLLDTLYLRIYEDGTAEELAAVDHGAVLCGFAWFLDGEDALLWQETGSSGAWDETVENVYRIPISPEAVWEGGRESILENASYVSLTELDEASYYGYPVPETGTEELLYLRLDRDGNAVYLSEVSPDALLSIQIGMPESELDGAAEMVNVQRRPQDEDTPWYWAKLTAYQDGVDVRIERTPDERGTEVEYLSRMENLFLPGQTLARRTLDRGEYMAVRVSLPWYPEMRVSVGKNGNWGGYVFGEDNYLHLENEDGSFPELMLAGYPQPDPDEYGGLPDALLHHGEWYLYDDAAVHALARFSFELDGGEEEQGYDQGYRGYDTLLATVMVTEEDGRRLYADWDRTYTLPYGLPDTLCLSVPDGQGGRTAAGDYRVDLYRTDGLELLRLTQLNNGDGILSAIVPGMEGRTAFTLVRWQGAGEPGARLRNVTVPAVLVRTEDTGLLWMQEAEQADVREDGSPVYLPIPGAPCLGYETDPEAAVPDAPWPMEFCMVSVDRNGVVYGIAPVPQE